MSIDQLGIPAIINPAEEIQKSQSIPSRRSSLKERLITSLIGWIPGAAQGPVLRRILYPTIFARIGSSVFIDRGVELVGTYNI